MTQENIRINTLQNNGIVNFYCKTAEVASFSGIQTTTSPIPSSISQTTSEPIKEVVEIPKEPSKPETPEEHIIKRFSLLKKHVDKLQEWSHFNTFTVLYSIEYDMFNSKTFFQKTKGQHNVMIIMETTSNALFGAFYSQMPNEQEKWVDEDPNHFIFTLKNPHIIPPMKLEPKVDNNTLLLVKNDKEKRVILETKAFNVCNDTTNKPDVHFSTMYHDSTFKAERLFAGNVRSYQLKNFAALQWE
ncbi:TLDc domain-containing protein [Entamoeba marina]